MKRRIISGCIILAVCAILVVGCIWKGNREALKPLEVRNSGEAIQWKYSDETEWNDLVELEELAGAAGRNGTDGSEGETGSNGVDGTDVRTIEVRKTDDFIEWTSDGEDWQKLVALSDIKGPSGQNGKNGTNGSNGKTPEFQVAGNTLQWRYQGKDDEDFWNIPQEDPRILENGFKFKVSPSDIYTKGVYTCDLIS